MNNGAWSEKCVQCVDEGHRVAEELEALVVILDHRAHVLLMRLGLVPLAPPSRAETLAGAPAKLRGARAAPHLRALSARGGRPAVPHPPTRLPTSSPSDALACARATGTASPVDRGSYEGWTSARRRSEASRNGAPSTAR